MVRVFVVRQGDREQVRERLFGVPAFREAESSGEKQQATAALVHEFANHFLLRIREPVGLKTAENKTAVPKQFFALSRKALLQFLWVRDALAVVLVLRRAK